MCKLLSELNTPKSFHTTLNFLHPNLYTPLILGEENIPKSFRSVGTAFVTLNYSTISLTKPRSYRALTFITNLSYWTISE